MRIDEWVSLFTAMKAIDPHSSPYSPKKFTRPQLGTILAGARFEQVGLRRIVGRLRVDPELRHSLELNSVPHFSTLHHFEVRLRQDLIAMSHWMAALSGLEMPDEVCVNLQIQGGVPCFRGTRVPVVTLLFYGLKRQNLEEFLAQFPTVRPVQAERLAEYFQITELVNMSQNTASSSRP